MPGRGRGVKRRGTDKRGPTTRAAEAKRARPAIDDGTGPDRGRQNTPIIDFEQIIRDSEVVHGIQSRETQTFNNDFESNNLFSSRNNPDSEQNNTQGECPVLTAQNMDVVNQNDGSNCYANATDNYTMLGSNEPLVHFNNSLNYANSFPQNYDMTRLAQDDIAIHVPSSIKQKICGGEYINMALLLKGAVELSDFASGSTLQFSHDGTITCRPKECKDDIGNIERWSDAFIIFISSDFLKKNDELLSSLERLSASASASASALPG
ncbi:uncharacterized protein LOC128559058 [Mercenaria mercenaria]|uniref:uncharacterized protein LOC128559058 n=1 Tax=Mercenaria mercenaria TaxID=6596 RepID=UPI00234F7D8A|nr:uncharacterized protein LOC128559058 [Mercenaria mercenaria]